MTHIRQRIWSCSKRNCITSHTSQNQIWLLQVFLFYWSWRLRRKRLHFSGGFLCFYWYVGSMLRRNTLTRPISGLAVVVSLVLHRGKTTCIHCLSKKIVVLLFPRISFFVSRRLSNFSVEETSSDWTVENMSTMLLRGGILVEWTINWIWICKF